MIDSKLLFHYLVVFVELPNPEPKPNPGDVTGAAIGAVGAVLLVVVPDDVELPKAPPNPLNTGLLAVDVGAAPNAEEVVVDAGEKVDEELVVLDENPPTDETGAFTALVGVLPKLVEVDVETDTGAVTRADAVGAAIGADAVGAAMGADAAGAAMGADAAGVDTEVDAVGAVTGTDAVGAATGDALAKKLVNPKLDAAPPAEVGAAVGGGMKKIGCPSWFNCVSCGGTTLLPRSG